MHQLSLPEPSRTLSLETAGVKYAGSKLKLLPQILRLVDKVRPRTVLDGFSGTTRVSQALAGAGYEVTANDVAVWSETFARCFLENTEPEAHYRPMIEHLNALEPRDGWFTEHYGGDDHDGFSVGGDGLKKPWQRHNTRKLDAVREEIDQLDLSRTERCVLLTSLIFALDTVDNTLGHYASYLNRWSPRSYKTFRLECPRFDCCVKNRKSRHRVFRKDVFELLPDVEVDLAYLDPPYGSNNEKMPPSRVRYASYYHLWTTVCLNDKPELFGKVLRRRDTSDPVAGSVFEEFRRNDAGRFVAVEAIREMLHAVRARYVLLSYNSHGKATAKELHEVLAEAGVLLEVAEIDHRKNVMAAMRWTNDWIREAEEHNREFLFLIEKT